MKLNELSALEAQRQMASGQCSAEELTASCLERISERDGEVQAWVVVDAHAKRAARERDAEQPRGPLHGIPVAIKDIIDALRFPTGYGCSALRGYQPSANAECVDRLIRAGAIILGKTVTTEFAYFSPGPTRNPRQLDHTPGGSSSGSAAAVADCHVPLALGTQTAGSIIRPASFNGIVGYKPTFGRYSLRGVHPIANSLDTLGGFARNVHDLLLLDHSLGASEHAKKTLESRKPMNIALVRTPSWERGQEDMRSRIESLARELAVDGVGLLELTLPPLFARAIAAQDELMAMEAIDTLGPRIGQFPDQVSEVTKALVRRGRALSAREGLRAEILSIKQECTQHLRRVFADTDLILTPSSAGEAPHGLESTGDPLFNRLWTFLGYPCISLPVGVGDHDLPLGAQFVAAHDADHELLAWTSWLQEWISARYD